MRASVPLELLRTKGDLTEANAASEAKAHSGRSMPSLAWIFASECTGVSATLAAAGAEKSFTWLRCA